MLTTRRFSALPPVLRYAVSVLIVLAADALRIAPIPWLGAVLPFEIAVLAIVVITVLLGTGPGLLSVVLVNIAFETSILQSFPGVFDGATLIRLGVSMLPGAFLVLIIHLVRVAQIRSTLSEERYENLVRYAPAAIYEIDPGTLRFVRVNDVMCRLLGYTRGELLSMDPEELFDGESATRFGELMRGILAGEDRPGGGEYSVRAKDGRERWNVLDVTVNYDGGRPRSISVVAHDVTERREREERLRLEHNKLLAIIENSPVAMAISDEHGGNIVANSAFEELWGERLPDATNISDYKRHRAYWVDSGRELSPGEWASAEVFRTGKPVVGQLLRIERSEGGTATVVNSAAPIFDAQGEFAGSVVTVIDVTERLELEQALRRKQSEIQVLFDNSQAGLVLFDAKPPYTVLVHNRSYQELFAEPFRSRGMVGLNVYDYAPEVEASGVVAAFEEVVRTRRPKSLLDFPYRPDPPKELWFNWHLAPVVIDGEVVALVSLSVDVTERRRAEEQVTQTLESIQDGFLACDGDWRFVYVNTAAERLIGMSRGELLGRAFWDVFPRTRDGRAEKEYRAAAAGEARDFESFHEFWGRWFHNRCFPRDGGGLAVYFEDITEKKRKQDEREKTMEFLRIVNRSRDLDELIDSAADFFRDKSGCEAVGIRLKSDHDYPYSAALGFSEEFLLSQKSLWVRDSRGDPVLGESGDPLLRCLCGDVVLGWTDRSDPRFTGRGSFWSNDLPRDVTAAERERLGDAPCACLEEGYKSIVLIALWGGDEVLGLVQMNDRRPDRFTLEDIEFWELLADYLSVAVSKFMADRVVSKIQEDLERAQAVGMIGNWRLDFRRNKLIWSDENCRIFGVPEGETQTYETFLSMIHPDDREEVDRRWKAAMVGEDYDLEHRIVVDGAIKWVREKADLEFDAEGFPIAGFGITQDITVRKEAEEVLRRDNETFERLVKERTEQLVEAQVELERTKRLSDIGVLAATVAHELRNPLAAISMAAHNIRRKARMPEIDRHLANIGKKVDESDQIISNLLLYSRLRPPRLETVRIYDALEEVICACRERQKKDISLTCDISSVRDISLDADLTQLKEVFNNILNNSVDAVPENGGRIDIVSEIGDDHVVFRFEDNGPGIPMEIVDRIFDPFFTTKTKGTGLGLSVCRQIVTMHGGEIRIERGSAGGACVVVRLPKVGRKAGIRVG